MPAKKHKPIHPGEVLKHDFMVPLGVTGYRLAKEIGVTAQHIGHVLRGTRNIGADLALRLARYFGTSAELWANLQAKYNLDIAEDRVGKEIARRVKPHRAA